MAKWKFRETLQDSAECLCFTSDGGMLLGHVKQNNEQGGVNFNVLTYEFRLCRIFAERSVVVYPLLGDVASLPGTF